MFPLFLFLLEDMAWHSKRHNIQHRKGRQDAKKAKIYAKIAKIITLAAKGGPDPDLNPALVQALAKAKQYSLPKDVVDKAIKKGSGQQTDEQLTEIMYEWYGPWGTALLIACITWNTNRSASNIKTILQKYGGSVGQPWSVAWQFDHVWLFVVDGCIRREKEKGKDIEYTDPLTEQAIEWLYDLPVSDMMLHPHNDPDASHYVYQLICQKDVFHDVLLWLREWGYHVLQSDLVFLPQNTVELDDHGQQSLHTLLDMLDEDEDVDTVYHNACIW